MNESQHNSLWESYVDVFKKACRARDYDGAHEVLNNACSDAEKFSEIDTRIIWCVYSLASSYLSHGHDQKAKGLYERLLELKEKVLGRAHPDFSDGLEKLALIQVNTQQYKNFKTEASLSRYPSVYPLSSA